MSLDQLLDRDDRLLGLPAEIRRGLLHPRRPLREEVGPGEVVLIRVLHVGQDPPADFEARRIVGGHPLDPGQLLAGMGDGAVVLSRPVIPPLEAAKPGMVGYLASRKAVRLPALCR